MTEFQAAQCPHCKEATEPGDHYEIDDGSVWHVGCYQHAMVESGAEDPFKLCTHCDTLIWETDPVQKGQVFVGTEARDAYWHPECAPGSDTPDEEDRVDHPPPQPASLAVDNPAGTGVEGYSVANPAPLGTPCTKCGKPIQRGLVMHGAKPFHRACRDKHVKTQTREIKADAKVVERSRSKRRGRVECAVCGKSITPADLADPNKFTEWENQDDDHTLSLAHRLCYRYACVQHGQADPYPEDGWLDPRSEPLLGENKENPGIYCGICEAAGLPGKRVLRSEYREHVANHERASWDGR